MNKKIIVAVIVGIIVLFVFIFLLLSSQSNKSTWRKLKDTVTVWVLYDGRATREVVNDFLSLYKDYSHITVDIVEFSNYQEYFQSLMSAFMQQFFPDIFVVANSDRFLFMQTILPLSKEIINQVDFKNNYDEVFSQDLIQVREYNNTKDEYLLGIPIGYETPIVLYNFRMLKGENFSTWYFLWDLIKKYREEQGMTLVGMGDGYTVHKKEDILSQFFVQHNVTSIGSYKDHDLKKSLASYFQYGSTEWFNQYNTYTDTLLSENKNNIDLFVNGQVAMIFWYPRILEEIEKRKPSRSIIRAAPFPTYKTEWDTYAISYYFFAGNAYTRHYNFVIDFLAFLNTKEAQKRFLEYAPYYLPAQVSLIQERLKEKVKDGYAINYENIYNRNATLVTFESYYKVLYDSLLSWLLPNETLAWNILVSWFQTIRCFSSKFTNFENTRISCFKK